MSTCVVAAFYRFAPFPDFRTWQGELKQSGIEAGLRGTILLAPEGINGTIAGPPAAVQQMMARIRSDPRFAEMSVKTATCDEAPFQRWRVRLKKEIVTMGRPYPEGLPAGTTADAEEWNAIIRDPETLVVDVRNAFEIEYGSFPGAVSPETASFGDFPRFVDRALTNRSQRLAIFCTGGIRCEKAAAYLAEQGFGNVVQLRGGILRYLQTVPERENQWQGTCFVFDEREAVDDTLAPKPGKP